MPHNKHTNTKSDEMNNTLVLWQQTMLILEWTKEFLHLHEMMGEDRRVKEKLEFIR